MFEFIKNMFRSKKTMNETIELKELDVIINTHLASKKLLDMEKADNYYNYNQDINQRKIYGIGKDGEKEELVNATNNKITNNLFSNILDQKTNYILSKSPTITTDNKEYDKHLQEIFNEKFLKMLFLLGKDTYKFGIGWLYIYYNEFGELKFKRFDSREIIPIWKDNDHSEIDKVVRVYKTQLFKNGKYEKQLKVELYTLEGIKYFDYVNNKTIQTGNKPYLKIDTQEFNWEKLPIIPFKANEEELLLINKCKSIQDAINEILSTFKNQIDETSRNTILVIKNYGGQGGDFRQNLNTYGYVAVNDNGGVETLKMEVDYNNYESIYKLLRRSMYETCNALDSKNDNIGANPNQMNIQSMYSGLDLDANELELQFTSAIQEVLWFINQDLLLNKKGDYTKEKVNFIFNRDILINESQAIEDCQKSFGLLSNETILGQHPWVKDVQLEIKRKSKENDIYNTENVSEPIDEE